ncbi:MAG: hypothetical protein JO141_24210 [Bradyrhizobium sp.]|nr:hypothetical protein [Bradyrhizobium sp.]
MLQLFNAVDAFTYCGVTSSNMMTFEILVITDGDFPGDRALHQVDTGLNMLDQ